VSRICSAVSKMLFNGLVLTAAITSSRGAASLHHRGAPSATTPRSLLQGDPIAFRHVMRPIVKSLSGRSAGRFSSRDYLIISGEERRVLGNKTIHKGVTQYAGGHK